MAKIVKATGPVPCLYALFGERPGIVEAKVGRVLCGPSGLETDRYLRINAGIDRASIYCNNVVKDYRDDEPPSPEEIQRDRPELERELKIVQPQYIMAMGLCSARWFLGDGVEMEWANGLAFPVGGDRWVMPVYHAAAGLHQPAIAAKVAYGFTEFGRMCRGDEMPRGHLHDAISEPYYREFDFNADFAAVDTEGSVQHPWCLSASWVPGEAYVSRKGDCNVPSMVLHNALHDLPVLAAMGVAPEKWTDTLLMAALLGVEPQGLKALARRHCGMVMQDYDSVIAPARREKALEYLSRAVDWAVEHDAKTEPITTD